MRMRGQERHSADCPVCPSAWCAGSRGNLCGWGQTVWLLGIATLAGGGSDFGRSCQGQRPIAAGDGAAATLGQAASLRLRGGSWLFTPKIVPVTDGQGGVIQWRQQPAKLCGEGSGEGPEGDTGRARAVEAQETGGERVLKTRAAAEGVQRTNDESSASKASAARAGYFQDDFVQSFVAKVPARTALINRGYFARVQAMRSIISAFLDACAAQNQKCQILSLGAGFDTTYWVMKRLQKLDNCVWVEVDFPETVARKRAVVEAEPLLTVLASVEDLGKHGRAEKNFYTDFRLTQLAKLYEDRPEFVQRDLGMQREEIHTGDLHCIGGNLADTRQLGVGLFGDDGADGCDVDRGSAGGGGEWQAASKPARGVLKRDVPTLVLTECVLQYLKEDSLQGLLEYIRVQLTASAFLSYDQIGPYDPFGQVMTATLRHRGSPLESIDAAPDLEAMRRRFVGAGYEQVASVGMLDVYNKMLPRNVTAAAEVLETFDEHEEWAVSCQHYCLTLAVASEPRVAALFSETPFAAVSDAASPEGYETPVAAPAAARTSSVEAAQLTAEGGVDEAAASGLFGHSAASV